VGPIRLTAPPGAPATHRSMTGKEPSGGPADPTAQARRLGEAEAEVAHLRLAVEESLARERRLIERALGAEQALDDALTVEHDLREQIGRYAQFHDAVRRSRPWRVIQFFRRLVGTEW
jgi:hypothetical protein